jgi:hypothetical protein
MPIEIVDMVKTAYELKKRKVRSRYDAVSALEYLPG